MNEEIRNQKIREYLREQGFKPRDDKDIKMYIKQLNTRLGKQNKKLYITESGNNFQIEIKEKQPIIRRNKSLYVRVTEAEQLKYEELAKNKNTDLSKLIRDLLDKECTNE